MDANYSGKLGTAWSRYNAVVYNKIQYISKQRQSNTFNQALNSQMTSHILSSRASYGVCFLVCLKKWILSLRWRHNERDGVSNHQPHHCLLNRLFRHRWKKTPKLRVTGLCAGNSPVTGEFPAQKASNAENVSIGWRHHGYVATSFYQL